MEAREIKEKIILDLEKAWENPREANYWLEKLPMSGDYDEMVHDNINSLIFAINQRDREYYDVIINDLVANYYISQENYNF